MELLRVAKIHGIDVAVETSGYTSWSKLERAKEKIDHFLFDIKALDSRRHLELTGVRNEPILENLKKLARDCDVTIRFPVVEGYNVKDERDAMKLAEICIETGVERVDLLRYHRFGEKKYRMLGRNYELRVEETGLIYRLRDVLKREGLKVSVNGLL
ncbi:MAG: radical SAM protein [Archaeoglobaceae archaeon]